GVIQLFDMIFVLTGPNYGGPGHAAETMAITMYRHGFQRFEVGYASAISVIMFLICLVFASAYTRFVMRRDIEGAVTNVGGRRGARSRAASPAAGGPRCPPRAWSQGGPVAHRRRRGGPGSLSPRGGAGGGATSGCPSSPGWSRWS